MKTLYEALREYSLSDAYPFHMPGHKRRMGWIGDPFAIDITEIIDIRIGQSTRCAGCNSGSGKKSRRFCRSAGELLFGERKHSRHFKRRLGVYGAGRKKF